MAADEQIAVFGLDEAQLGGILSTLADLQQSGIAVPVDEAGLRSILRPPDPRLAGVPCAVRVAHKKHRYFNCSGLEIGKDAALSTMGGLVWHVSGFDPVQSSLRRYGKFIHLQDAYAVVAGVGSGDTSGAERRVPRPSVPLSRPPGCRLTFFAVIVLFFVLPDLGLLHSQSVFRIPGFKGSDGRTGALHRDRDAALGAAWATSCARSSRYGGLHLVALWGFVGLAVAALPDTMGAAWDQEDGFDTAADLFLAGVLEQAADPDQPDLADCACFEPWMELAVGAQ